MKAKSNHQRKKTSHLLKLITVHGKGSNNAKAIMTAGNVTLPCVVGRMGIGAPKREGDGKTPRGYLRVLSGFYQAKYRNQVATRLNFKRIKRTDGWCDDPLDCNYNRHVVLPYAAHAEKLYRDDHQYDLTLVLDWNISERRKNRGSAIFLHLAKDDFSPTQGCIALKRRDLVRLLPHLSKKTHILIKY